MIFLGIDGGQTSTKACLYDVDTGEFVKEKGQPIDHMLTSTGQDAAKNGIQQTIKAVLVKLNRKVTVDVAVLSISGVRKEHEELIKSWVLACVEVYSMTIVADVEANLAGASAGENDGILVIAGGGSIAYFSKDAIDYTAGGYGHILGDEGSAYWIGINALQAGIRFSENRGPATMLHEQLLHHFQAGSYWDIKTMLHSDQIKRSEIANLAYLVNNAAGQGDEVAQHLLMRAGVELGNLAVSVMQSLAAANINNVSKVYPTGGMFQSEAWVMPTFIKTIQKSFPGYSVVKPKFSPLIGTLILAAETKGMKLNLSINVED